MRNNRNLSCKTGIGYDRKTFDYHVFRIANELPRSRALGN